MNVNLFYKYENFRQFKIFSYSVPHLWGDLLGLEANSNYYQNIHINLGGAEFMLFKCYICPTVGWSDLSFWRFSEGDSLSGSAHNTS